MAIYYSDVVTNINAGQEEKNGPAGFPGSDGFDEYKLPVATYTLTGDETASDFIQMHQIPANHIVTRGYLRWEDLGTDVEMDLGITGGVTDCFVDGALGGTAGWIRFYDAAAPTVAADYAAGIITTTDTIDIDLKDAGSFAVTAGKDIEVHVWVQKLQNT